MWPRFEKVWVAIAVNLLKGVGGRGSRSSLRQNFFGGRGGRAAAIHPKGGGSHHHEDPLTTSLSITILEMANTL